MLCLTERLGSFLISPQRRGKFESWLACCDGSKFSQSLLIFVPIFQFLFLYHIITTLNEINLAILITKNKSRPVNLPEYDTTGSQRGGKLTHDLATKQFSLTLLFLFPSIFREGENVVQYPRLFSSFQRHPSSFMTYLINKWIPFY